MKESNLREDLKIVFIAGCGRSGTTLMFKILAEPLDVSQDDMLCLNEPRELYLNAFGPFFDIWSKLAP